MGVSFKEVKSYQKKIRGPIGKLLDTIFRWVPWLAINNNISANMITFLSLVLDFLAVAFILKGWFIYAGILVMLSYIGDISDGTIARYQKQNGLLRVDKGYGPYLDEVLGVIGFSAIVLALGFHFDTPLLAIASLIGILMMNITTAEAKLAIKNKQQISKKLQNHRFKDKYQLGFTCDMQRTFIAIAVMIPSVIMLALFAIAANAFWLLKFWVYRNE